MKVVWLKWGDEFVEHWHLGQDVPGAQTVCGLVVPAEHVTVEGMAPLGALDERVRCPGCAPAESRVDDGMR